MNKRSHIHKKADSSASNPARSQLQSRPFIAQAKSQSQKPLTQTGTENQEFQQQKFEATKLELQAKYDTITPEGQERLTVLQTKMSGSLHKRLEHASSNGRNFAKIPISRPDAPLQEARPYTLTPVQEKLTIGEPGGLFELEADNMATKVMSMSAVEHPKLGTPEQAHSQVPSKPLAAEITPFVQQKAMPQSDRRLQGAGEFESRLRRSKGGGSPLPVGVQAFMGPRYGADVSDVRVHTGSEAVQMNQAIDALAFTHGKHIYYGAGQSPRNDQLTAHELAHTFQQTGSAVQREQLQRMETSTTSDLEASRASQLEYDIKKLFQEYEEIANDKTKYPNRLGILDRLDVAINEMSNALQNIPESSSNPNPAGTQLDDWRTEVSAERVAIETEKQNPGISLASSQRKVRFSRLRNYVTGKSNYETVNMLKSYGSTDLRVNEIKYLNEKERQPYKVAFESGKLKYADGSLIDTTSQNAHGKQGFFIYVMDANGNIYTAPTNKVPHHSSFLAGRPVAAAGAIKVKAGILQEIQDESGHYAPTKENTQQFEKELKKHGVNMTDMEKNYKYNFTKSELKKKGYKPERILDLEKIKNDYKVPPQMTKLEEVQEFFIKARTYAEAHLEEKKTASKDRLAGWKAAVEKIDFSQLSNANQENLENLELLKQAAIKSLNKVMQLKVV